MLSILKSAVGGVTKTELLERIDGSYIMLNEVLTFLREYGLISEERDSESGVAHFLTTKTGLDLLQSTRYFKEIDEVKTAFEEKILAAA
jgi:predicted transcriptional regulator